MKKNQWILLASVIVGVAAAVAATLLILKKLKEKKEEIEPANLSFEEDFEDAPECIEEPAESDPAEEE